jgi:parvulin-like peptidyl-prolyl isomerase
MSPDGRFSTFAANRFRSILSFALCLLLAASASAQDKPELEGPPPPDLPSGVAPLKKVDNPTKIVVARVNGLPIFQSEVERGITAALGSSEPTDPKKLALAQAAMLQQIVNRKLFQDFLISQKLVGTKSEVDVAIEKLKNQLVNQNSTFEDMLGRMHQTEAAFRRDYGYEIGWNKYVAKNSNDENMAEVFKAMHEQVDGTERRVSHILLRLDGAPSEASLKALVDRAKQLREDITSGKISFEDAAAKYSGGPSRTRGGDLGYIPVSGVMVQNFSKTAFSLKPDEISPPVVTPFGVHLIKVTDTKPGAKTWQDVRDQLQQTLSSFLLNQIVKAQQEKASIQFAAGVPHFKKGTTEMEYSEFGPNLQ